MSQIVCVSAESNERYQRRSTMINIGLAELSYPSIFYLLIIYESLTPYPLPSANLVAYRSIKLQYLPTYHLSERRQRIVYYRVIKPSRASQTHTPAVLMI
jgi:hypothetical protein